MSATLCQHGKSPTKCGRCKSAQARAERRKAKFQAKLNLKADRKAAKKTAKSLKKSAKYQAKQEKKKINVIKNAAKDMKSPWHADGSSRSGVLDSRGRNRNGIRYDDNGKRIWKD